MCTISATFANFAAELSRKTGLLANHILATLEWMECLVKRRDGRVAVNYERILRYGDALLGKNRPIV